MTMRRDSNVSIDASIPAHKPSTQDPTIASIVWPIPIQPIINIHHPPIPLHSLFSSKPPRLSSFPNNNNNTIIIIITIPRRSNTPPRHRPAPPRLRLPSSRASHLTSLRGSAKTTATTISHHHHHHHRPCRCRAGHVGRGHHPRFESDPRRRGAERCAARGIGLVARVCVVPFCGFG